MITGRRSGAPAGLTIRALIEPVGPPETVTHSSSTAGLVISPAWTSSTALRPSTGPRSNRYGGLAVAAANSAAAGSSTGVAGVYGGIAVSSVDGWRALSAPATGAAHTRKTSVRLHRAQVKRRR